MLRAALCCPLQSAPSTGTGVESARTPKQGYGSELKLALYVYEYLLHVGAQKSAQTFLSEIRWEKNITLGEPPGFLHSWWCIPATTKPYFTRNLNQPEVAWQDACSLLGAGSPYL
ncbi:single-stranded DNA-binding protein 3 [Cricetulus griseus]|nr:single-stranded DNA-binding protein 3 [Cricetulus griseus]